MIQLVDLSQRSQRANRGAGRVDRQAFQRGDLIPAQRALFADVDGERQNFGAHTLAEITRFAQQLLVASLLSRFRRLYSPGHVALS